MHMRTVVAFLIGCVFGATGALMYAETHVALPPVVQAVPGVSIVPGDVLIPVVGVVPTQLQRNSFNEHRGGRTHEALDILAPRGTPVVAAVDGKIRKLFTSRAGGLTIYQYDRAEEKVYYYAHLDHYADSVREGLDVHQGDVIGYVGTTGNAPPSTPHLHFAISVLPPSKEWWKGTAIDPYPVLATTRASSLR